jgi:DNA invertase Pin-like site-specific DNA recombinase
MASLAEFERSLIAERVKAGMQRAKAQGKHTGRPALPCPALPHPCWKQTS